MTRPLPFPIGFKGEAAMVPVDNKIELVCPFITLSFSPRMHDYDPKRHNLIEGVGKCRITRQEAQTKFNEYLDTPGSHTAVYPDSFKRIGRVGQWQSSTAISAVVTQPATTCPKDCQTTTPSLLLRLQPSPGHWTVTDTWAQFLMI